MRGCIRAVVRFLRYVLGSARLSPWSAVLHRVNGGPCGPGYQVRCLFTPNRTTHSCTCTSVATNWRHPPISSSAESLTSATGCPPTDRSSTQTRQDCCSPAWVLLRSPERQVEVKWLWFGLSNATPDTV